jgi:hypothetical protein
VAVTLGTGTRIVWIEVFQIVIFTTMQLDIVVRTSLMLTAWPANAWLKFIF